MHVGARRASARPSASQGPPLLPSWPRQELFGRSQSRSHQDVAPESCNDRERQASRLRGAQPAIPASIRRWAFVCWQGPSGADHHFRTGPAATPAGVWNVLLETKLVRGTKKDLVLTSE
jgi:anti-sigma factor RsiW